MPEISFKTQLFKIGSASNAAAAWTILHLPPEASAKLPSRGMVMVSGTLNGVSFKALLEPDGRYAPGQKPSHWFRPDEKLLEKAHVSVGDTVEVSLTPTKEWIETEGPDDF